jgi:hypothetical protein
LDIALTHIPIKIRDEQIFELRSHVEFSATKNHDDADIVVNLFNILLLSINTASNSLTIRRTCGRTDHDGVPCRAHHTTTKNPSHF